MAHGKRNAVARSKTKLSAHASEIRIFALTASSIKCNCSHLRVGCGAERTGDFRVAAVELLKCGAVAERIKRPWRFVRSNVETVVGKPLVRFDGRCLLCQF